MIIFGNFGSQEEDSWRKIQRRVVLFLGYVGPRCYRLMAPMEEDQIVGDLAIGWQAQGNLNFALPLSDMNPILQLEVFLPRVLHLALNCGWHSYICLFDARCYSLSCSGEFNLMNVLLKFDDTRRIKDENSRMRIPSCFGYIFDGDLLHSDGRIPQTISIHFSLLENLSCRLEFGSRCH